MTPPDEARKGSFIVTYTGKYFYPLDPRVEDVDVNDIIHALSNTCRFAGHSTKFYSVAQHCVLVSLLCPPEVALWGLLHDAGEAYLSDIPSPMKKMPEFEFYRQAEQTLMKIICDIFDLSPSEPDEVKVIDKRILATEARDLTLNEGRGWITQYEPYDFHIQPWTPEVARVKFMSRMHELMFARRNDGVRRHHPTYANVR